MCLISRLLLLLQLFLLNMWIGFSIYLYCEYVHEYVCLTSTKLMTKEGHQQKFNKLMFMFMCTEEKVSTSIHDKIVYRRKIEGKREEIVLEHETLSINEMTFKTCSFIPFWPASGKFNFLKFLFFFNFFFVIFQFLFLPHFLIFFLWLFLHWICEYLIKFTTHNQSQIERLTESNFENQQMWTFGKKFYFNEISLPFSLHYWLISNDYVDDDDDDEFVS